MTYDTTNAEEPNDDVHDLHEVCSIRSYFTIYLDVPQKVQANVEIEDGADSNGPKEAYIQCLPLLVNLMYVLVHGEDDRWSTEQENQNPKEYKANRRYDIVVEELIPRTHSTVPDENGDVEEHIERWLEGVILSLESKPVTGKRSARVSGYCNLPNVFTYSQVNTFPAMKHASTSSEPIIPQVPTMKSWSSVRSSL
jgi:hypothetical protein